MSDLLLLSEAQMRRIEPYFPLSHGVPRVDDRRIISGIIFVIRNGLRWRDAPKDYGPHKTIYNRFIRWSRLGVFNRILAALSAKSGKPRETPLHAIHLRNMATLAEMGAIIAPPVPAFYNKPKTLDDVIDHTIGRVLDLFDLDTGKVKRWS